MKAEDYFKVFFNWTMNSGVTYYRMVNFAKFMRREENVNVAFSHYDPKNQATAEWEELLVTGGETMEKVIKDLDMLMDVADISVWQVTHNRASYSLFRAYREKFDKRKVLLTETDDYLFGVNPENLGSYAYSPNSDLEYLAEMQLRNSNGLIVSTDWLAEQYRPYNPSIKVIPNSIDFEVWDKVKNHKKPGRVRIGWSGGGAHGRDLRVISKIIGEVLEKYRHVDFVFLGGVPQNLPHSSRITHVNTWHGIDQYPKELGKLGFDIGIAPLRDNLFNRAKSNLRWLEYSALKIPTVASPVEPFSKCIQANVTGLFAQENEEWVSALCQLIEDAEMRQRIGQNAYNEVKANYSAELAGLKYLNVLRDFAQGKEMVNTSTYDGTGVVIA